MVICLNFFQVSPNVPVIYCCITNHSKSWWLKITIYYFAWFYRLVGWFFSWFIQLYSASILTELETKALLSCWRSWWEWLEGQDLPHPPTTKHYPSCHFLHVFSPQQIPLYMMTQSSKTAKADDARAKAQAQDSVISTTFYGQSKLGSIYVQKERKQTSSLKGRRTWLYRNRRNYWWPSLQANNHMCPLKLLDMFLKSFLTYRLLL